MDDIGIDIERQYEEDYEDSTALFSANSGIFQGGIEIKLPSNHLKEIGKVLSTFPKKFPDEYSYKVGLNQSNDKSPYFVLRIYTRDNQRHTALQVTMNNKKDSPEDGECCFSLVAEQSGLHRLGKLIQRFSDWKYHILKWSPYPDKDSLVEWEHPKLPNSSEPKEGEEGETLTFRDWNGI